MDDSEITPSRKYYFLAGVVFIGGIALFAGFLFKGLSGMGAGLQQVVAPGETDLTLREPGNYTIFYEYHSVFANKVYSTDQEVSGLECSLVSKHNTSRIALSPSSMSSSYQFSGRSGRSILEFNIDQPGVYTLTAAYPPNRQGPEVVLAVGKGFATGILTTVLEAIAIMFGSMGTAVVITLVTMIKRIKQKKLLAGQA